jgi:hypothetical protein
MLLINFVKVKHLIPSLRELNFNLKCDLMNKMIQTSNKYLLLMSELSLFSLFSLL